MSRENCLMYRYRPLKSILQYQELENQEIYFSTRKELNDPLEGYFSSFYRGSRSQWELYLKVYIRKYTNAYLEAFYSQCELPPMVFEKIYHGMLNQVFFSKMLAYEHLTDLEIAEDNFKLILSALAPFLTELVTSNVDAFFQQKAKKDLYDKFVGIQRHMEALVSKLNVYMLTYVHVSEAVKENYQTTIKNIRDTVSKTIDMRDKLADFYLTIPEMIVESIKDELANRFRIASFSPYFDNSYMWGNYADNCNGICLAFKKEWLDDQGLQPVQYKKANEKVEAYRVLTLLQNYMKRCFSHEDRKLYENDLAMVRDSFLIKLDAWRSEAEYRLLLLDPEDATFPGVYKITKKRYDFAALDSIIFGMRVNQAERWKVIGIINQKIQQEGKGRQFVFYEMYYDQIEDKLAKREYYTLNKDYKNEMEKAGRKEAVQYEPVFSGADEQSAGQEMYDFCQSLFPICRSITGEGVRKTLGIISESVQDLIVHEVPSGTKVFDWVVPREWNIRDAWVKNEQGEKIIDFKKSNLHIVGYSLPMDKELTREELLPLLHTQPDQPDAIPYVTSYYEECSGFCITHRQKESLPIGRYHAYIDSDFKDGNLTYGELVIPGSSEKEILLSTNVCHPSMANNELSGPAVMTWLAKWLLGLRHRRYTYRLLYLPETIGSLTYMGTDNHLEHLQSHVVAGFVLSCVGDNRTYSYVASRTGGTLADKVLWSSLHFHYPAFRSYSFLQRGSDERQYNAPGVDLPVCAFCRSKYSEFPEYHTSLDNMNFISPDGLQGSYEVMQQVILALENNYCYKVQTIGEPQLGKRGLYPTLSQKNTYDDVRALRDFLAYADGKNDLIDISNMIGISVKELLPIIKELTEAELIKAEPETGS